jgi:hypothetical protein
MLFKQQSTAKKFNDTGVIQRGRVDKATQAVAFMGMVCRPKRTKRIRVFVAFGKS